MLLPNVRLGSLSVVPYHSQGYGGGILARTGSYWSEAAQTEIIVDNSYPQKHGSMERLLPFLA
jgi:hypothetical protein